MSSRDRRPTVYLHIGTAKSGTTYLQSRFAENHRRAAAQGLLWPGPSWGRHVAAVRDLHRLEEGQVPASGGAWDKLAREAVGWGGQSVLISMVGLSWLRPDPVRMAVESLRPARVEVICTARDLLRSFVAQGREMTKNFRTWPWSRLVDEVLHDTPGPAHRVFWRQQDVPRILERWLDVVPADRVHLVTLPPAGADPDVLWHRFCDVLGVDGSGFEQPHEHNPSLGVVSTVLMQRLNTVAASRKLTHDVYDRALRQAVAVEVLGPHRREEGSIGVSAEMEKFLRDRAGTSVQDLQQLGVVLHGAWDDLVPSQSLAGRDPESVSDAELLDLCAQALVTLAVSRTWEVDPARGRPPTDDGDVSDSGITQPRRRAVRRGRGPVRRARADRRGRRGLG